MRILFLSSYYPPRTRGGAEISTHYLAQGLLARGHEVTVVTQGPTLAKETFEGVSVISLPLAFHAKPLFEERHARRLAAQLRTYVPNIQEYDVVHAHDFRMTQVAAVLKLPHFMVTVRDYAAICGTTNAVLADGTIAPVRSLSTGWRSERIHEASWLRKPFRLWQYLYNLTFRERAFSAAATHVYISHAQQGLIARYASFPSTRTVVIYNPVGDMFLQNTGQNNTRSQNLLYVGTIETYKGVGVLLEAFEKLANEFTHLSLTIVGEGAQCKHYQTRVAQSGLQYRVQFKGKVPLEQLRVLYDQASAVVAPHIWIEPFGRTVVEAMARGALVVASDAGGPSETIVSNKTGFLFTRDSAAALADTLRRVLGLPDVDRREVQQAARAWVAQHLSQATIAQQYEAEYTRLLR